MFQTFWLKNIFASIKMLLKKLIHILILYGWKGNWKHNFYIILYNKHIVYSIVVPIVSFKKKNKNKKTIPHVVSLETSFFLTRYRFLLRTIHCILNTYVEWMFKEHSFPFQFPSHKRTLLLLYYGDRIVA